MILLEEVQFWYWFIAAVIFVVIEIFAPGAVFIWLGFGATVVGGVKFFQPDLSLEYQLLIFAIMSLVSAFGWRAYRRKSPAPASDQPTLNRRGAQYVGRTFTLSEPIVNGQGKIKIDDTIWKIEGEDLEAGIRIAVIGVDGTVLRVGPADA